MKDSLKYRCDALDAFKCACNVRHNSSGFEHDFADEMAEICYNWFATAEFYRMDWYMGTPVYPH